MQTLIVSLINTIFWISLHFIGAGIISMITRKYQNSFFNSNNKFFQEKSWEKNFYKKINIYKWKDKLPQYNVGFNKRNLKQDLNIYYIDEFIYQTIQAEVVHINISILGFLSLFSCFMFENPINELPLFFAIALFIGLLQVPFILIQRYNRPRLLKLKEHLLKIKN